MPKEGYEEEYEKADGTTGTRFVVTKHMYTDSKWVEPKTVECNEIGYEVKTPMYHEVARKFVMAVVRILQILCLKDGYNTHAEEEALNGNTNCGSGTLFT